MSRYLLGLDVGTTSLKTALIDEDTKLIGLTSSKYRIISPTQESMQIDARSMWDAFLECLRSFRDDGMDLSRVAGISISSLCPGLVALDENNKIVVNPIMYSDRRSTEEADMILNSVGSEKLFELTANGSMAGAFSGSSMPMNIHARSFSVI